MAIERSNALIHWNYFLALEEDLDRLSRFVDLSGNESTFSIEIARLFLSSSAETDVVMKSLAQKCEPDSSASSINAYFPVISGHLPKFTRFVAEIPRFCVTLRPWVDWTQDNPPLWWQDHNKVKHHRQEFFARASLKNCLNSVAALYSATVHLYADQAEEGVLPLVPRLFAPGPEHAGGTTVHGNGMSLKYKGLQPVG